MADNNSTTTVLSGSYLAEFRRLIKALRDRHEKEQDVHFGEWSAGAANDILLKACYAVNWDDTVLHHRMMDNSNLSLAELNQLIAQTHGAAQSCLAQPQISTGEFLRKSFLELCAIQNGKQDEYICQKIIGVKPSIFLCSRGKVSASFLKKRPDFAFIEYPVTNPERVPTNVREFAEKYISSLWVYKHRLCPGRLLDVYHRARIVISRVRFEMSAEVESGLQNHALRERQQTILRDICNKRNLDLSDLEEGISF